jgi:hypothetical protein
MRFVILHYHIFKNAGSTIEEILERSFGEGFARFDTLEREARVLSEDLLYALERNPHWKAVSSHQIRYPVPKASGLLFFDLCFLRDPIDRIRSMYDYFRMKPAPGDIISKLANEAGLGEFIAGLIERFPLYVENVQVNLLARGGDSGHPEEKDLELAIDRMLKVSFLGVVDCFKKSVIAGQHFLSPVFPALNCDQPPVNVSRGWGTSPAARIAKLRDACENRVYAELLKMNALDKELVERARTEVERRFKLVPNRIALELEDRMRLGQPSRCFEARDPNPSRVMTAREKRCPGRGSLADEFSAPPRAAERVFGAVPIPLQPTIANVFGRGFRTTLKRLVQVLPYMRVLWPLTLRGRTPLFDAEYYLASDPDVAAAGVNPLLHFIVQGAFEGRKPHPLFDTAFYLRKYPDVAAANTNPLGHYLKYGAAERRQPNPLFDPDYYFDQYPDVRKARINPLLHYVRHGAAEGRKPHALFQPDYYLSRCAEARRSGGNLLVHFLESGWKDCFPHPLFDGESYLRENPDVAAQGLNPLVHYLLFEQGNDRVLIPPQQARLEMLQVAHLNIQDMDVEIIFLTACDSKMPRKQQGTSPTIAACAARAGLARNVVLVWQDTCGRTQFIAEPQQSTFFHVIDFDQLYAQANQCPCFVLR